VEFCGQLSGRIAIKRVDGLLARWLLRSRFFGSHRSRSSWTFFALFSFIGTWTDYLGPLVYLHDERQFTLALGLTSFLGRHGAEWNLLMAAATVVTAPLIVLFLLTQRTFVKGVALSGLKG